MRNKVRKFFHIILTILLSVGGALLVAEWFVRTEEARQQRKEHLDQGMYLYDLKLGWKLSPDWSGRHEHADYDVSYTITRQGYRDSFPQEKQAGQPLIAFVGDSFTFGLGVGDGETFVDILDEQSDSVFVNCGIPGYSTDQQCLLIEDDVLSYKPDQVILMVQLVNDVFDNERPYPLQANRGKPHFVVEAGGLVLTNVPVPMIRKSQYRSKEDLASVVSGQEPSALMRHSALARMILSHFQLSVDTSGFEQRFASALDLFRMIVTRAEEACDKEGVALKLVLLPGRSYVTRPDSPSAAYQEYLRARIVEQGEAGGWEVLDLAHLLRERYESDGGEWFYKRDGHLTPEGHRVVADLLAEELETLKPEPVTSVQYPVISGR